MYTRVGRDAAVKGSRCLCWTRWDVGRAPRAGRPRADVDSRIQGQLPVFKHFSQAQADVSILEARNGLQQGAPAGDELRAETGSRDGTGGAVGGGKCLQHEVLVAALQQGVCNAENSAFDLIHVANWLACHPV